MGETSGEAAAQRRLLRSRLAADAALPSFNLYNKSLLRAFNNPVTVSALYMGVGGLLGLATWGVGLVKRPELTREQLLACVPLAVCHALTNTFMLTSLSKVAVSLSHTIRVRGGGGARPTPLGG